jgi:phosphatidylglycerol:prolipoprotein diacylglycerol transferase
MLAHYVHNLSPFVVEFRAGFGLRWYGLAYVLAFLLGFLLYRWLAIRRYTEMPPNQVGDFITWAAVFGVMLGGRLGWAIFYGGRELLDDPLQIVQVWKGGMASHGGILGLVLFTLWYARRHRLSWTSIGDSLCVVAPLGIFLVRIANFINGELYGRPANVSWAVIFPPDPQPRHPSQLYEAILEGAVLFLVLWLMRTKMRVPRGAITGTFFILYAVLRIIGEFFREPDPAWSVGAITAGQFLSFFLIAIGALFLRYAWKHRAYEPIHAATAVPDANR